MQENSNLFSTENTFVKYFLLIIFFAVCFIGLWLRIEALLNVHVNEWVIRDFDRAFRIIDGSYIPLAGPELGNGGRLPGPFMYFLAAVPLIFHQSYESIFFFNFCLKASCCMEKTMAGSGLSIVESGS